MIPFATAFNDISLNSGPLPADKINDTVSIIPSAAELIC
jgi:hypothetical protein